MTITNKKKAKITKNFDFTNNKVYYFVLISTNIQKKINLLPPIDSAATLSNEIYSIKHQSQYKDNKMIIQQKLFCLITSKKA